MQTITFIALLIAAAQTTLLAEQSPQEVQQSPPVEHVVHHHHHQQQQQQQHQSSASSAPNVVPSAAAVVPVVPGQQQPSIVVSEVVQGPNGVVEHQQHPHHISVGHHVVEPQQYSNGPVVYQYSGAQQQQQQQVGNPSVSYYSPTAQAGLITVVGSGNVEQQQQQQNVKPVVQPKHYATNSLVAPVEQYGQPESASIPANYKPFGSWGLYIGGNPADGYYTNYYKSLGNSVEKQVGLPSGFQPAEVGSSSSSSVGGVKPVSSQQFISSPLLRQASGSPYVVGSSSPASEVYPVEHGYYTPADLNSGSASRFVSPVQAGSQVYGTPSASYEPGSSLLSYAPASVDSYATKRLGSSSHPHHQQQQQQQHKGYQARTASYGPSYASSPAHFVQQASGVAVPNHQHHYQQQQQPQVVAYPVPVGSQIVGSQPGIDGAFQPFGVHAFTRYAVKPTVVEQQQQQQQYYQPSQYKQVGVASPPHYFYGYPLSQLHYSNSLSPASSIVHQSSPSSSVGPSPSSSSSSSSSSSVVGGQEGPQIGHHSPMSLFPQQVGGVEQQIGGVNNVGVYAASASEKSEVAQVDKSAVQQQQQPAHSQVDMKHTHQVVDKQQKRA